MMFYPNAGRRRCFAAVSGLLAVGLLLAGCGGRQNGPAPLILGTETEPPPGAHAVETAPPAQVTVRQGQSLSGIARSYHVSLHALAEANHLRPPYRVAAGQVLVIPAGGAARATPMPVAVAALPPARQDWAAAYAPPLRAATPVASPPRAPAAAQPSIERPVSLIPPAGERPQSATLPRAPSSRAETPPALAPSRPDREAGQAPAVSTGSHPSAAAAAAAEPHAEKRPGGSFLWPVRGRVIARFGTAANGTHNDGINIAAPQGAAIEAVEGGIVAYVGNELRGYGNLILIKHPSGWITAYAHCDMILVKRGQKVGRGQTIARVGMTGNVSEPQLHFELRRGDHPVDPLDHLALPATATARGGPPAG